MEKSFTLFFIRIRTEKAMLKKAYLEITNVCNLNCAFCPGTRREKRFMSPEEFRLLSAKLKGNAEFLYFHLMGEPLLHPELKSLLEIAGEQGFKVIITTNGSLLDRAGETLLGSEAVYKVNISLQSFEANPGGGLEGYVGMCAAFAAKAAEKGKLCVLRLWNENGLDRLNGEIKRLLASVFPLPWREGRNSLTLAPGVFLERGPRFDWPGAEAPDRGGDCFCYGLRDQIGVLCDGTVVPCCLDHEGDIPLGNLFESSLESIMSTDKAKKIYRGFSQRQVVEELCRGCGYARRFT